jgi:hypothetical protein
MELLDLSKLDLISFLPRDDQAPPSSLSPTSPTPPPTAIINYRRISNDIENFLRRKMMQWLVPFEDALKTPATFSPD